MVCVGDLSVCDCVMRIRGGGRNAFGRWGGALVK